MERNLSKSKFSTRKLVSVGLLSAISIFLGLTGLGFIPIPPVKATILHVPVIIGAILEGPLVGALVGLFFGLFSIYNAFVAPTPISFVFWNPIVAVLPRILIGLGSYYIYIAISKLLKNKLFNNKLLKNKLFKNQIQAFSIGFAAICGSLINTIGVLGLAYIIYLEKFATALGLSASAGAKAIAWVAVVNGIPEAIVSALITIPIVLATKKAFNRK